jgi:hypothetical protein
VVGVWSLIRPGKRARPGHGCILQSKSTYERVSQGSITLFKPLAEILSLKGIFIEQFLVTEFLIMLNQCSEMF